MTVKGMTVTLPSQHALISLLSARNSKGACPHPLLLALLNDTQCAFLKGPLLDTVASLLNLTEYFNTEATPGCRLFDNFTDLLPLLQSQWLQILSSIS